ncbi:unnamed protein product [Bursaphelenchus xylophilus]|uniref:(pine wood nematode) hypothetical protein n=1 Tax=Bursaphelenchus xylophilus TaxID=6326 RepID=A0A1I7RU30_BURXY|nr:unnamed protein product [Bursaphelenchus xylophilus]CAG9113750.1 unnamed protein product [Bursaphelenchus xylophilus]
MIPRVHQKPAKYNIRGQTQDKEGVICADNHLIGLTEKVSFTSYSELLKWMIHYEFNANVRLVKMSSNLLDGSLPEEVKRRFIFDRMVFACHNHDSSDRYVKGELVTSKRQGKGCVFTFTVLYIRAINRLQMMSGCFYHTDGCVPSAESAAEFNPRDPQSKKKVAILNELATHYIPGDFTYVATNSIQRFKGANRDKNAPIIEDAENDVPALDYPPEMLQAMDEYVEATMRTALASKAKKRRASGEAAASAAKRSRSAPLDPREISLGGEEASRPLSVPLQPVLNVPAPVNPIKPPQKPLGGVRLRDMDFCKAGLQYFFPKFPAQPLRQPFAQIQPFQPPIQNTFHHQFYWEHTSQVQYEQVPQTPQFAHEVRVQEVQQHPQPLIVENEPAGFDNRDLFRPFDENIQEVPGAEVEDQNLVDDFGAPLLKLNDEDWDGLGEFFVPPMSRQELNEVEEYLNCFENGENLEMGLFDLDVPVAEPEYFNL